MHIWLITVGEPLPELSGDSRLWRTGMLAQQLVRRGHTVTWWTSRVDHFRKQYFETAGDRLDVEPGLEIRFLDGRLYRRNIGVARLVNHWQIARDFRRRIAVASRPDVILCSFPTIELSAAAVHYGKRRGVPVVLDVRDLWPDIFLQPAPAVLRGALRTLLHPYFSATRRALSGADAVVAVSRDYLQWGRSRGMRGPAVPDRVFPLAYSLPARTVDARASGRQLLQRYGVESGSVVCVFAGTLGRTYDLAPVLEAAKELGRERDDRFRFVICGDGERAEEWRERAQDLENVRFTGWLGQTELRAALMGSDVGLAAYADGAPQGLPNKVIEYLAASLPVVSSLTGETSRLLAENDCGLSYVAGDGAGLHAALLRLGEPAYRECLSQRARSVFEEHFQAERVYSQFASYLEALAG